MALKYTGHTLSDDTIQKIAKVAKKHDFPLDYAITLLHFEGLWGNSEVAKLNNNWGGMTWTGDPLRPSGITVSKGTARPANEGGHYMRYDSVDDFLEDWAYLLRDGGIYKVAGAKTFDEAVRGMFKVGGAKYDYAASGYDHYLKGMRARRTAINQANNGGLDDLIKGVSETVAVTAKQVLDVARGLIGAIKYGSTHKKLINDYNKVTPRPVSYAVKYDDDWCDAFVTVVADRAGATSLIGRECGVERHKSIFKQKNIWLGLVKPQAGDIVIWRWDGNRNGFANHIGFVESVSGNTITTIEGNTFKGGVSQVGRNTYPWNAQSIQGYARPKYGQETAVKPQVVTEAVVQQVLAGAFGNGQDRVDNLKALGYNPDEVQEAVNKAVKNEPTPITTDAYLTYNGNSLSKEMINDILEYAKEYNFNPVFLIVMLHFEGLWGGSEVAKLNNNLAGITWSSTYNGHPDVPKSKGSSRPADEGGHYVKYNSVSDFLKDWTYLLRPDHFYKVTGNKSFNDSIKGLFIVGGAKYDYAASGYAHYLSGMNGRKNAIEKQNPGKLDAIQKAFNEGKDISGQEIIKTPESPKGDNKTVETLAKEVIKGLWGVGEDRVTRLTEAGYDYAEVQAYVNLISAPVSLKQLDDIAKDVINGKYGNGKDRTDKLQQEGYDVKKVQARVNELLKEDLTEVAKDVIRGQYGNGEARVRNLRAVGYNPDDVQVKVNELLG